MQGGLARGPTGLRGGRDRGGGQAWSRGSGNCIALHAWWLHTDCMATMPYVVAAPVPCPWRQHERCVNCSATRLPRSPGHPLFHETQLDPLPQNNLRPFCKQGGWHAERFPSIATHRVGELPLGRSALAPHIWLLAGHLHTHAGTPVMTSGPTAAFLCTPKLAFPHL